MIPRRKSIANVDRLHTLMDEAGLDAVVLRSGQNFTYLSGVVYPGTLARHQDLADSARAVMLLWPRHGEPVIIANKTAAGLAQRDAWVERIALYEGYVESPYAKLADVMHKVGLAHARVGFEKDYVSARDWEYVQHRLQDLDMVDCTELMNRVRWIKTPAEVQMIQQAADLLDEVYLEVFSRIRPGDTERKIHADMIATSLAKGFEWAHGILNSDKNTIAYAGESDRVIALGDVIRTDYVAYLGGYPGHQSRNVVMGPPSALQREEYRINLEIYRATIDRCRAGTRVGDLHQFVMDAFDRRQWAYKSLLVGHGVGAWWHQQEPILRRGSDIVLEAGMVLALEPHKDHWHVQDMILVQEHGAPLLLSSRFATDEPFIVGA
ncbi:Xaa-Pro peptidase family protein [Variovorax sp. LjRoot84]|uniref:M24 family metallopeptidase n=1 Tax=unclassified Variovorax TaxID=663243 RepID=UPI003ECD9784